MSCFKLPAPVPKTNLHEILTRMRSLRLGCHLCTFTCLLHFLSLARTDVGPGPDTQGPRQLRHRGAIWRRRQDDRLLLQGPHAQVFLCLKPSALTRCFKRWKWTLVAEAADRGRCMRCDRAGRDPARTLEAEGEDGVVWRMAWCAAAANCAAAPVWRQMGRCSCAHARTNTCTGACRPLARANVCAKGKGRGRVGETQAPESVHARKRGVCDCESSQ